MKIINVGLYDIIEKNENSIYDTLICKCCNKTCKRINFSRHKKSPKHIKRMEEIEKKKELTPNI
jgi:hypothetical protein